ncbi:hypothetical protein Pst134EA_013597 [Puccinia striiformis f. sp. tritici]|uniref:hypothetical protein n=1 Tax=Puccinia striiformis f. sp. tritici TaxID=168172 RepID=UPI002007E691|nr:hypothetical protein Pst134EA_013597 [Puccinia striiformis f. sp. tritici]KAH9465727.1 hypothetical protein Pst134EA_013597 [Puccinia striiformis f. sp. tritici]
MVNDRRNDKLSSLSDSESDLEEDDDPVVKRIPLFFNSTPDFSLPSFAHFKPVLEDEITLNEAAQQQTKKKQRPKTLTLLQYPFKSSNPSSSHPLLPPSLRPDPINNPQQQQPAPIHAKYKPGVRSLRLDLPLETKIGINENRFSDERAREFAKGLPDNQKNQSSNKKHHNPINDDECDPLDKMSLGSTLIPEQSNYAVGVLKGGNEDEGTEDELHIIPLDQILQMRPNLDYLDQLDVMNSQADKQARREQGLDSGDSEGGSSNEEPDEEALKKKALAKKKTEALEAKAIQVSVIASGDGDRVGAGLRSGGPLFAPLRAAEAETPINLIHYHSEVHSPSSLYPHCLHLLTLIFSHPFFVCFFRLKKQKRFDKKCILQINTN